MPRSRDHILDIDQRRRLISVCESKEDLLVVGLLMEVGLRVSEVAHLKRSWVKTDGDAVLLSVPDLQSCTCAECQRKRGGKWTPKTENSVRSMPVRPELGRELLAYLAGQDGFHKCREVLWATVKALGRRAGVVVFPHALRATAATRLAERGISAATLQYYMGWASVETAEFYVRSNSARAKEELQKKVW